MKKIQFKKDDILVGKSFILYSGNEYINHYQVIKSTAKTVWLKELRNEELNNFLNEEVLQRRITNTEYIKIDDFTKIML